MNVKLFCIYHKKSITWRSDCIEPIQSGCAKCEEDLHLLRDDTGDNISMENNHYGELSVWYWVWKNYLPINPSLEYIGFCHYRRFLCFYNQNFKHPWHSITLSQFIKKFKSKYNTENISSYLNTDIIISPNIILKKSVRELFHEYHGKHDLELFVNIVKNKYPQHVKIIDDTLNGNKASFCLNFIMKKQLFIEFMTWLFPLLNELKQQSNWENYTNYENIRMPAYITERFLSVWLNIITHENKITVKELPGILIQNDVSIVRKILKIFLFLLPKNKRRQIRDKWKPTSL